MFEKRGFLHGGTAPGRGRPSSLRSSREGDEQRGGEKKGVEQGWGVLLWDQGAASIASPREGRGGRGGGPRWRRKKKRERRPGASFAGADDASRKVGRRARRRQTRSDAAAANKKGTGAPRPGERAQKGPCTAGMCAGGDPLRAGSSREESNALKSSGTVARSSRGRGELILSFHQAGLGCSASWGAPHATLRLQAWEYVQEVVAAKGRATSRVGSARTAGGDPVIPSEGVLSFSLSQNARRCRPPLPRIGIRGRGSCARSWISVYLSVLVFVVK